MDTTNPTCSKLRIPSDALYLLLYEGCSTEFNTRNASGEQVAYGGAICWVWMPTGWTSATVTSASRICAASIFEKRCLRASASMLR